MILCIFIVLIALSFGVPAVPDFLLVLYLAIEMCLSQLHFLTGTDCNRKRSRQPK